MVFSSLTFLLLFLPSLTAIYYLVPGRLRTLRNMILLLFSVVFYAWGEPLYVLLMFLSISITYLVSKKVSEKNKLALVIGILVNLGPLALFKYTDFVIENINLIPGINLPKTNLLLPIGISFYTFQILTYVIDLYREKVNYQKNPFYVALYVFLFPQLIAGPIVRYETVEFEIENRKETWDDFQAGFGRFVSGLAKKVLIANNTGLIYSTITTQDMSHVGSGLMWLTVLSFAIQIYFDFSGYSDMAIGMGKMFGFHFLENFEYPYTSGSITEFWRRWHISLSTFFRDYVYIPLGGNRVSQLRWLVNIIIVWFLTGLWHGPFWNYIIWGLYYGILLIIEKMLLGKLLEKIPIVFRWAYTFILTLFGWTIFMTETNSISQLMDVFAVLLSFISVEGGLTIRSLQLQHTIPYLIIGFILSFPIAKKLKERISLAGKTGETFFEIGKIALYLASLLYIVAESFNPFIYFRF